MRSARWRQVYVEWSYGGRMLDATTASFYWEVMGGRWYLRLTGGIGIRTFYCFLRWVRS